MSDEKPQNPKRPRKPRKPKSEVGDQRLETRKVKAESREPKAESKKPKAASVHQPNARTKNKPIVEEIQNVHKSEIRNPNSEIQSPEINMEVHHHPQLDHKPKPIKEYLLEGLMIFIAVMMGFIAENIREDITNREHAHQLVTQLVRDLKADTASLDYIYKGEARIFTSNNALFMLLQQPLGTVDTKKLLKLAYNSDSMYPFHATGGAIGAIKAELHLKQFSKSSMIRYFAEYEGRIELLHTMQDITLQYQHNYLEPFLTQHFSPSAIDAAFDGHEIPDTQVRNLSQNDLTQLATRMVFIKTNTRELLDYNRLLKKNAVDMLKYIRKEYGEK